MEASSVLVQDEAVGTAPPPPPNEKGNDAGAGGSAVESGNGERVVDSFRHSVDNLSSKADEVLSPPYPSFRLSFGFRTLLSHGA